MRRILGYLLMIVITIIITGCGSTINYNITTKKIKVIENKNYTVNDKKTVYVGESMIKEKNYFIYEYASSMMSPLNEYTMKSKSDITFRGDTSSTYEIMGTTIIDDKKYTALYYNTHLPRKYESFKLLIDENNMLYNKVLNGDMNIVMIWDFDITPKQVSFTPTQNSQKQSDILKDKPYINYELIYSGINKDTIRLLYREYTVDDMARASFFQELTYPKNSNFIRFKKMKIKIHNVTGEQITFSVL